MSEEKQTAGTLPLFTPEQSGISELEYIQKNLEKLQEQRADSLRDIEKIEKQIRYYLLKEFEQLYRHLKRGVEVLIPFGRTNIHCVITGFEVIRGKATVIAHRIKPDGTVNKNALPQHRLPMSFNDILVKDNPHTEI